MSVVCIAWNIAYLCSGSQGPFITLVDPSLGVNNNLIECQYIPLYFRGVDAQSIVKADLFQGH